MAVIFGRAEMDRSTKGANEGQVHVGQADTDPMIRDARSK